jgi:hypothetical protein
MPWVVNSLLMDFFVADPALEQKSSTLVTEDTKYRRDAGEVKVVARKVAIWGEFLTTDDS